MGQLELGALGQVRFDTTGQGTAVIFLHSGLTDGRQWDGQVAALSSRYLCVRADMPGFGGSSDPGELFDPTQVVFSLMDHLGIERAHIVGSSMGGSTALHAAVQNPKRVASLFLAGTGMFGYTFAAPEPPPIYHQYEQAYQARDVFNAVRCGEVIWLWGISGSEACVSTPVKQHFEQMNREYYVNHFWQGPKYLPINDALQIGDLAMPVMMVIGDKDTPYCLSLAEHLRARIPHNVLRFIPGAAHFPNLTHPCIFNAWLLQWLAEHD